MHGINEIRGIVYTHTGAISAIYDTDMNKRYTHYVFNGTHATIYSCRRYIYEVLTADFIRSNKVSLIMHSDIYIFFITDTCLCMLVV